MIDKSNFRTPAGMYKTKSLFLESYYELRREPVYTFKDCDYEYRGKTYISLKQRYLEMEDPTEYTFANEWLLGWKHWQSMLASPYMRPHIDEWREELELKLRAKGIKQMIQHSYEEKGMQASRWLAEKGFLPKQAGRPTKAQVEKEAAKTAELRDHFADDLERLKDLRH